MTLALYRKYRPRTFAEIIGQEQVTEPLTQALRTGRLNHAYLFSGPRGCGKTSSARILARSLNCAEGPTPDPCGTCDSCRSLSGDGPGSIDVIEIDAASHGGVDDARELRERAVFAPVSSRYKIYVIDEAHMVSSAGFNALLKLVEEPPEYVKFIFATTEPDKVLGTIKSRTHHYPFRLIPPGVLRPYLERLCAAEEVSVDPAVLPLVVRAGGGSARDTLSVLDQLIGGAGPDGVTYARAVALLGVTDAALIDRMCESLGDGDGAGVYATVHEVAEAGHDPRRFAADLLERLRDLIVLQQVPDAVAKGLIDGPADQLARMAEQARRFGAATLSRCADIVHDGLVEMRGTASPRLLLELVCARMLLPGADDTTGALLQRLERLERSGPPAPAGGAAAGAGPAPGGAAWTAGADDGGAFSGDGSASGGGRSAAAAAAMAAARAAASRGAGASPRGGDPGAPRIPHAVADASADAPPGADPAPAADASLAAGALRPADTPLAGASLPRDAPLSADAPLSVAEPLSADAHAAANPPLAAHAPPARTPGGFPDGATVLPAPPPPAGGAPATRAPGVGRRGGDAAGVGLTAGPRTDQAPEPVPAAVDAAPGDAAAPDAADGGAPPADAPPARPQPGAAPDADRRPAGGHEPPARDGADTTPTRTAHPAGPGDTAPGGSTPRDTALGGSTPRDAAPGGSTPRDAAPGASAPQPAGERDVAQVRRQWVEVLDVINRANKRTAALARDAVARDVVDGVLVLTVRSAVLAQMLGGQCEVVADAVYQVLGQRWRVRCEPGGAGAGMPTQPSRSTYPRDAGPPAGARPPADRRGPEAAAQPDPGSRAAGAHHPAPPAAPDPDGSPAARPDPVPPPPAGAHHAAPPAAPDPDGLPAARPDPAPPPPAARTGAPSAFPDDEAGLRSATGTTSVLVAEAPDTEAVAAGPVGSAADPVAAPGHVSPGPAARPHPVIPTSPTVGAASAGPAPRPHPPAPPRGTAAGVRAPATPPDDDDWPEPARPGSAADADARTGAAPGPVAAPTPASGSDPVPTAPPAPPSTPPAGPSAAPGPAAVPGTAARGAVDSGGTPAPTARNRNSSPPARGVDAARAAARAAAARAAANRAPRGSADHRAPEGPVRHDTAWSDGAPLDEPPYDPDYDGPSSAAPTPYDGFDPGDGPTDDVADEVTARRSSEEQAWQLLRDRLGAEEIGTVQP